MCPIDQDPDSIASRDATESVSEALDALRDELLALHPRSLVAVNVDVASAALIVIGALPEIQCHRPALVELCGEDKARSVDRLDVLAHAALQAQAQRLAFAVAEDLQPLAEQLVRMRDLLLAEVRLLIARDVLEPSVIRELTMHNGYRNLCMDVLQLVAAVRGDWDVVQPKTQLTKHELGRAESLANEMLTAVAVREHPSRCPATDLRDRAYTLLATTYDDVRRMISYLRWKEGDADRIAPAVQNNRWRRRRTSTVEQPPAAPITPEAVRPGLPGAPPFTDA